MSTPIVPVCSSCTVSDLCASFSLLVARVNAIDGQNLTNPMNPSLLDPALGTIPIMQAQIQGVINDLTSLVSTFEMQMQNFKNVMNINTAAINTLTGVPAGTNILQ
jgi:hypothetical protein